MHLCDGTFLKTFVLAYCIILANTDILVNSKTLQVFKNHLQEHEKTQNA